MEDLHRVNQELSPLDSKGSYASELSSYAAKAQLSMAPVGTLAKLVAKLSSYFSSFYCLPDDRHVWKKVSKLSKANMMVPFLCLPPEIIFHVLCFLQPKDLAQMQLTCRSLSKYVSDEWLWKCLCLRDFSPVKNVLASYFGKNWKWLYRSKARIFHTRGQIKDGDVGTLVTKDGRYEGEWKNTELHGYGFLASAVGNIIEGQWKNGMGHGFGRVSYANGDLYAGQWTDGGVTGKGVCYFMEGTVYKGEWKNNAVQGKGTCWFNDGNKYHGYWKMGKKDGPGVFYWKNRATWKGNWKNNKPEGKGKHFCPATNETILVDWQADFECCRDVEGKDFTMTFLHPSSVTG